MREAAPPRFTERFSAVATAARQLLTSLLPGRRVRAGTASDGLVFNNRNDGPPDLDELWRDFNRKLSGLFGGKPGSPPPGRGGSDGPSGGSPFQPDMKSAGIGVGLIAAVALLIWLGSGIFIVQEGNRAVVTTFGKYSDTVDAGLKWRMPYPVQAHEIVAVS